MEPIFAGMLGLIAGAVVSIVSVRLPQSMQRETESFVALMNGKDIAHEPYPLLSLESLAQLFPLSLRTVAVCLLCALLSALAIHTFGVAPRGVSLLSFTYLLATLFVVDVEAHLLPDDLTYSLLWLGLLVNIDGTFVPLESAVLGAVAAYLALWALAASFKQVTKNDGMGNGDFKLMAALGAWHGHESLLAMLAAAFAVAIVAWIIRAATMPAKRQHPFAFGPYLAVAGLIAFYL